MHIVIARDNEVCRRSFLERSQDGMPKSLSKMPRARMLLHNSTSLRASVILSMIFSIPSVYDTRRRDGIPLLNTPSVFPRFHISLTHMSVSVEAGVIVRDDRQTLSSVHGRSCLCQSPHRLTRRCAVSVRRSEIRGTNGSKIQSINGRERNSVNQRPHYHEPRVGDLRSVNCIYYQV